MKKLRPFSIFLILFSFSMLILCCFGWYQVDRFVDDLEISLQKNATSSNTNESTDYIVVEEDTATTESDIDYVVLDPELYTEVVDLAYDIGEKYAKFTSGDISLQNIENYFVEDSDILVALNNYSSRRYDDHDAVYIDNMILLHLHQTDIDEIEARITFDYKVSLENEIKTFPSDYSIFIQTDDMKISALAMN